MKKISIILLLFVGCFFKVANAGTLYFGYDSKNDKIDFSEGESNNIEYDIAGIIQKAYLDEDNIIRLKILGEYNKEYNAAIPVEWCDKYRTTPRKGESYESISKELLNWINKKKEDEAVTHFRINDDGSAEIKYKDYSRNRPIYYYDKEAKRIYVSLNFPNDIKRQQEINPNSPARQIINNNPTLKKLQDEADKHSTIYFSGRIKSVDITKDKNIKLSIQTAKNTFYTGTIYIYTYDGNKTISNSKGGDLDYIFNKMQNCVSSIHKNGTIANFYLTDDNKLTVACKKYNSNFADPIYSIINNEEDPTKDTTGILLFEDMGK